MTIITDDVDDDLDLDEAEIRTEVLRRARSEGALVAYESALEIAGDKSAPAVARASSQRTLLALAGLLDKTGRDSADGKAPSEMSPDELADMLAKLKRDLEASRRASRRLPRKSEASSYDGGVFD